MSKLVVFVSDVPSTEARNIRSRWLDEQFHAMSFMQSELISSVPLVDFKLLQNSTMIS